MYRKGTSRKDDVMAGKGCIVRGLLAEGVRRVGVKKGEVGHWRRKVR